MHNKLNLKKTICNNKMSYLKCLKNKIVFINIAYFVTVQ